MFILEEETTGNYKILKTIQGLDPKVSSGEKKLEPVVISGKEEPIIEKAPIGGIGTTPSEYVMPNVAPDQLKFKCDFNLDSISCINIFNNINVKENGDVGCNVYRVDTWWFNELGQNVPESSRMVGGCTIQDGKSWCNYSY